jgi:hypothetical protein
VCSQAQSLLALQQRIYTPELAQREALEWQPVNLGSTSSESTTRSDETVSPYATSQTRSLTVDDRDSKAFYRPLATRKTNGVSRAKKVRRFRYRQSAQLRRRRTTRRSTRRTTTEGVESTNRPRSIADESNVYRSWSSSSLSSSSLQPQQQDQRDMQQQNEALARAVVLQPVAADPLVAVATVQPSPAPVPLRKRLSFAEENKQQSKVNSAISLGFTASNSNIVAAVSANTRTLRSVAFAPTKSPVKINSSGGVQFGRAWFSSFNV